MKLKTGYSMMIACLLVIAALCVMSHYRWHTDSRTGDLVYKHDRWADQEWVDYYPPSAISNGIEIPLMNKGTTFSSDQEAIDYLVFYSKGGYVQQAWVKRTRITDFYLFVQYAMIIITVAAVGREWRKWRRRRLAGNGN